VGSEGGAPPEGETAPEPAPEHAPEPAAPARRSPRRRLLPLALLVAGGAAAAYLASSGPRTQHLRLVLGDGAARVDGVTVQYVTPAGEAMRESRLTFEPARAPRVVALDPELPDGDYRLEIDLDTREGRRSTERRVTLGGGSTSVDLAGVLRDATRDERDEKRTPP
jgi:hypothetical protein